MNASEDEKDRAKPTYGIKMDSEEALAACRALAALTASAAGTGNDAVRVVDIGPDDVACFEEGNLVSCQTSGVGYNNVCYVLTFEIGDGTVRKYALRISGTQRGERGKGRRGGIGPLSSVSRRRHSRTEGEWAIESVGSRATTTGCIRSRPNQPRFLLLTPKPDTGDDIPRADAGNNSAGHKTEHEAALLSALRQTGKFPVPRVLAACLKKEGSPLPDRCFILMDCVEGIWLGTAAARCRQWWCLVARSPRNPLAPFSGTG